jgi:hypothetical protein
LVEADFQREYGIDLMASLDSMSWRRFVVLLGGLSLESRTTTHFVNAANAPKVLSGKAAERAFARW